MSTPHTKFYLDKLDAKWKGVCAGIADYTGIDVIWIRLAMILSTIIGGFPWTLIAYWCIARLSEPKPIALYKDAEDQRFWQGVRQSPQRSTREVKSRLRSIDRRLADIEIFYTSKNSVLSSEIENLR